MAACRVARQVSMTVQTLDAAQRERDQLMRNYRASKAKQLAELYADPEIGDRLHRFVATLNHFKIEHADRMIEFVAGEARKWLAAASPDIRHVALEAVNNRCMRLRERAGLPPIDDPLPSEPDSVFIVCRRQLGL